MMKDLRLKAKNETASFVPGDGSGVSRRSAVRNPSARTLSVRLAAAAALALAALTLGGCAGSEAKSAYLSACEALEGGSFEQAEQLFGEVTESGYYLSQAYRGLGLAQMAEADYADACISFEKSLLYVDGEDDAYIRDVNLYLACCRERQGQADRTMEIYNTLIKKEPDTEVLFLRGRLNLKNGNVKAARNDFDQAIALGADYDLYINIYEVYESVDKTGDGAYYLEEALEAASRNEDDLYNQGLVSYYLQNYEEAKDTLIQAVRRDSSDSRSVFLLGKVYLAMDDIADARAVFREHTGKQDTAAAAYNGLALCDIASGDYENALQNVEAGLESGDESSAQGLLFNEIVIYEQMRDWKTARSKAAAYVGKYPGDEAGLREYEFLSTR